MGSAASAQVDEVQHACLQVQQDKALWTALDKLLESAGGAGVQLGDLQAAVALNASGSGRVSDELVERIFASMDRRGRGFITREDFMLVMRAKVPAFHADNEGMDVTREDTMVLWQLEQLRARGSITSAVHDQQVQLVLAGKPPSIKLDFASSASDTKPERRVFLEDAPPGSDEAIGNMVAQDDRLGPMAQYLGNRRDAEDNARLAEAKSVGDRDTASSNGLGVGGSIPLPSNARNWGQAKGLDPLQQAESRRNEPLEEQARYMATQRRAQPVQQAQSFTRPTLPLDRLVNPTDAPVSAPAGANSSLRDASEAASRAFNALRLSSVARAQLEPSNLSRPDFDLIADLVQATRDEFGFGASLYPPRELDPSGLRDTAAKARWLQKSVDLVGLCTGAKLALNSADAVVGRAPEATLDFMKKLAECAADDSLDLDAAVQLQQAGIRPGEAPPPRRAGYEAAVARTSAPAPTHAPARQHQSPAPSSMPTSARTTALAGVGIRDGVPGALELHAGEHEIAPGTVLTPPVGAPAVGRVTVPRPDIARTDAHSRCEQAALATAQQQGWGMVPADQRQQYGDEGRRLLAEREAGYNSQTAQNNAERARQKQEHDAAQRKYQADLAAYNAEEQRRRDEHARQVAEYEANMAQWQEQQQHQANFELQAGQQMQQMQQEQHVQEESELAEAIRRSMEESGAGNGRGMSNGEAPVNRRQEPVVETAAQREERELAEAIRLSQMDGGQSSRNPDFGASGSGAASEGALRSSRSDWVGEEANTGLGALRSSSDFGAGLTNDAASAASWDSQSKDALAAALGKANTRMSMRQGNKVKSEESKIEEV